MLIERRRELSGLATALGLALGLVACVGSPAVAQHTPDPYNIVGEYNNQFAPFMYAREPSDDGVIPNQTRFRSRSGNLSANRFESFLNGGDDSIDGSEPSGAPFSGPRRSGIGTPYYKAFRRYDQDFNRVYRPNEKADESFYSRQRQRDDLYFQAMQKSDPKKRAQLLREYNLENLRVARGLSTNRNAPSRERPGLDAPSDETSEDALDPDRLLTPRRPAPRAPSAAPAPGRRGSAPAPSAGSGLNPSRVGVTGRESSAEDEGPLGTGRRSGIGPPSLLDRTPSSILERSRLLDRPRGTTTTPSSGPGIAPRPR